MRLSTQCCQARPHSRPLRTTPPFAKTTYWFSVSRFPNTTTRVPPSLRHPAHYDSLPHHRHVFPRSVVLVLPRSPPPSPGRVLEIYCKVSSHSEEVVLPANLCLRRKQAAEVQEWLSSKMQDAWGSAFKAPLTQAVVKERLERAKKTASGASASGGVPPRDEVGADDADEDDVSVDVGPKTILPEGFKGKEKKHKHAKTRKRKSFLDDAAPVPKRLDSLALAGHGATTPSAAEDTRSVASSAVGEAKTPEYWVAALSLSKIVGGYALGRELNFAQQMIDKLPKDSKQRSLLARQVKWAKSCRALCETKLASLTSGKIDEHLDVVAACAIDWPKTVALLLVKHKFRAIIAGSGDFAKASDVFHASTTPVAKWDPRSPRLCNVPSIDAEAQVACLTSLLVEEFYIPSFHAVAKVGNALNDDGKGEPLKLKAVREAFTSRIKIVLEHVRKLDVAATDVITIMACTLAILDPEPSDGSGATAVEELEAAGKQEGTSELHAVGALLLQSEYFATKLKEFKRAAISEMELTDRYNGTMAALQARAPTCVERALEVVDVFMANFRPGGTRRLLDELVHAFGDAIDNLTRMCDQNVEMQRKKRARAAVCLTCGEKIILLVTSIPKLNARMTSPMQAAMQTSAEVNGKILGANMCVHANVLLMPYTRARTRWQRCARSSTPRRP